MTEEYLLVDGYNIVFAWKDLSELAQDNLEAARMKLADILCDYQGYSKKNVILVFDGHKAKGNLGSAISYHNISIIYTKEAETADQYIEKVTRQFDRKYQATVATSDALEQLIIMGAGAIRMSARELEKEIERIREEIRETYIAPAQHKRNTLLDNLPPEAAALLERLRNEKE